MLVYSDVSPVPSHSPQLVHLNLERDEAAAVATSGEYAGTGVVREPARIFPDCACAGEGRSGIDCLVRTKRTTPSVRITRPPTHCYPDARFVTYQPPRTRAYRKAVSPSPIA